MKLSLFWETLEVGREERLSHLFSLPPLNMILSAQVQITHLVPQRETLAWWYLWKYYNKSTVPEKASGSFVILRLFVCEALQRQMAFIQKLTGVLFVGSLVKQCDAMVAGGNVWDIAQSHLCHSLEESQRQGRNGILAESIQCQPQLSWNLLEGQILFPIQEPWFCCWRGIIEWAWSMQVNVSNLWPKRVLLFQDCVDKNKDEAKKGQQTLTVPDNLYFVLRAMKSS